MNDTRRPEEGEWWRTVAVGVGRPGPAEVLNTRDHDFAIYKDWRTGCVVTGTYDNLVEKIDPPPTVQTIYRQVGAATWWCAADDPADAKIIPEDEDVLNVIREALRAYGVEPREEKTQSTALLLKALADKQQGDR